MALPSYEDFLKENGIDASTLEPCSDEEFEEALREALDEMEAELKDVFSDEAIEADTEAHKEYLDAWEAAETYEEKLAVDKKYKQGIYAEHPDYDGLPYIE